MYSSHYGDNGFKVVFYTKDEVLTLSLESQCCHQVGGAKHYNNLNSFAGR